MHPSTSIRFMIRRLAWIGLTALAVPFSFVSAPYPRELLLQHVPTVIGILLLLAAVLKYRPSSTTFYCSLVFLWLHIVGARWIYSYVPYDEFSCAITGRTLSEIFGWQRNHYDRLVHFASGVLGLPILSDFLRSFYRLRPLPAAVFAMFGVLAIGAMYEILEWQIAMAFSPEMAESYNGQQGDMWDAQKDLALAWLGAIVCIPLIFFWD